MPLTARDVPSPERPAERLHAVPDLPVERAARTGPALVVVAFAALLFSYIWLWNGAFAAHTPVMLSLYFGIGLAGHAFGREGPKAIGLRLDTFAGSTLRALALFAPVVLVAATAGWLLDGWNYPAPERWPGSLAWGVAWGTAQQYGLLAVFFRRLSECMHDRVAAVLGGVLFGLFHLPNPFLTALTAFAGVAACVLYRRDGNLLAIGVAHGIVSFLVGNSLPSWVTLDMRVGPGAFTHPLWPF